nr:reverse transcriptase domain-containing protein [Tanacetum cinerariifolium]
MVDLIRLDFEEKDTEVRDNRVANGKVVVDCDLKNLFKEAIQTPLTRRIIELTDPETGRYNLLIVDWKELEGRRKRYSDKKQRRKMLLANVAEIFDNLRKINTKLNPNKCSIRVEEGKFLGYMVTFEGIRENPKKTKALVDLPSPRTLKEMQSLDENLSALNRFLWTIEADEAFQQMKRCILNLPSLTPPFPKETMYAYLAVSKEAMNAILMTDKKGRKCLVHYVSQTLNEAERNYAPMEKLALYLINMTRRLRRYFEARLVKVITDQPIKQILSKTKALGKLAKYVVELGTYSITFKPRNVVKGQVLAGFISQIPDGEAVESYFRTPKGSLNVHQAEQQGNTFQSDLQRSEEDGRHSRGEIQDKIRAVL